MEVSFGGGDRGGGMQMICAYRELQDYFLPWERHAWRQIVSGAPGHILAVHRNLFFFWCFSFLVARIEVLL